MCLKVCHGTGFVLDDVIYMNPLYGCRNPGRWAGKG